MKKTILIYAVVLGAAVFLLEWLGYQKVIRSMKTEAYIAVLAIGFMVMGVWVGVRLTRSQSRKSFEKNTAAIEALGITNREYRVLELLSQGHSNKQLARKLKVSPNTIKTHLAKLYAKLDVQRRTQAVQVAKKIGLIP